MNRCALTTPPARRVPVLMYHATPREGDAASGHDPHYAVGLGVLARHLAAIRQAGLRATHVRDAAAAPACALTFDDGHASHAEAARLLAEHGASADFFVNSAAVGGPDRLDWPALRAMAAAGMSIQSHGHTHRHFDTLSTAQIRDELQRSKDAIEQAIGQPVELFAPPGGRLRPEVGPIARELGYRGLCTSRAGTWQPARGLGEVPRLAVLASTDEARLGRWLHADPAEMLRLRLRQGLLDAGKRGLGRQAYERLRGAILGMPRA
jgi:peptidoglycan/xylan/chitin deacetylase (PgdA/CDA1 family)